MTPLPEIPDDLLERLAPYVLAYIGRLDDDAARPLEDALATPGGITAVLAEADDGAAEVRVTALLPDGPHLLMILAPSTIGWAWWREK